MCYSLLPWSGQLSHHRDQLQDETSLCWCVQIGTEIRRKLALSLLRTGEEYGEVQTYVKTCQKVKNQLFAQFSYMDGATGSSLTEGRISLTPGLLCSCYGTMPGILLIVCTMFPTSLTVCNKKGKATPITGLCGPEGSGRLRLQITRHSVRSSPLTTGRLYPQEYPGTHFQRLSRPQGTRKCQLPQNKFQASPPGIDPGSYRPVASVLTTTLTVRNTSSFFKQSVQVIFPSFSSTHFKSFQAFLPCFPTCPSFSNIQS